VSSASFEGRVALVTGGAGGIGARTLEAFAEAGARTVSFDLRPPAEPPDDCRHVEVDVSDFTAVGEAVRGVLATEGRIDCLVNNAGIARDATVWKMTEEQWNQVIAVNLKGAFNTIRHVAPHYREHRRGKIVNVSSVTALRGKFGLSNYAASKAGLIGLTRAVAAELARYDVNVNAVAPGMVLTPLVQGLAPEYVERARADAVLGRLSSAEDVAGVVRFLCSEAARQITGEVIRVDGGQCV
jgi:NAD(P)-dependent dehydrogenase (short-subunit alcohol dehydrogenase family)